MKTLFRTAALAAACAATLVACGRAAADPVADKLKATLQSRLGADAVVKGVAKTPIAGVYEVNLGRELIYSDAHGNYLLVGHLIDARTRDNLTDARLSELNRVDFAGLPFGDSIKFVRGKGTRRIAVFSDPNCPYCRQLEETLKNVDDVTVYTFLYPVLSDASVAKAKALWCSADRAQAWHAWMLDRQAPNAAGRCDTAVLERNLALGAKLGVNGTPTIFFADGGRLAGALSADELEQRLSARH